MVFSFFQRNFFRILIIICDPRNLASEWSLLSDLANFRWAGLEVARLGDHVSFFVFEVFDNIHSLSFVLIWCLVREFYNFWGRKSFFVNGQYFLIVLLSTDNCSSNISEGFSNSIVGGCLAEQSAINCWSFFDRFGCDLPWGGNNITFFISASY